MLVDFSVFVLVSMFQPTGEDLPEGQTVSAHEEKKKAKRKIALEVLKVDYAKDQPVRQLEGVVS